jgi:hypothetical protein
VSGDICLVTNVSLGINCGIVRRWAIGLGLAVAAGSLAGAWPAETAPASAPSATKGAKPLYGIVGEWRRDARLARLDPRSLRPLRGPKLDIVDFVSTWAFSPGRSRLALGTACQAGISLGTLQLVDLRRMRPVGCFAVGPVAAAAWVQSNRLLVIAYSPLQILLIDPNAGRIVRQTPIGGAAPAEIARVGDRLVVLTRRTRDEPERLVVADARGSVRSVGIPIRSAGDLVVDRRARRAYVVSTGAVAEVDLDTLEVADHELREHVSLRMRRLAVLTPTAQAKEVSLTIRRAFWVGGGVIAFTGYDATIEGRRVSARPVGLKLIDTRNWTVRTVNGQVSLAVLAGNVLLATGGPEIGLVAYDFRGAKRYQLFVGRHVDVTETYGGRAYIHVVGGKPVPKVIDVRSGRALAKPQTPLNLLLVERARWRTP